MATGPQTPVSSVSSPKRKHRSVSSPQTDVFPTPIQPTKATPSSPPRRQYAIFRASSTPPELTNVRRPSSASKSTLGDLPSTLQKSRNRQQLSKKWSQYYDSSFADREPNNSARERVAKDSIVTVEVKVNFPLEPQSQQSFLTDFSFQLSEIYQRPEACIMVAVLPGTAMLLAGSTEPAYHITVSALPSEIASTKNKRSTALIQAFINESLRICSDRGVVRFDPIKEENLATHGKTMLQEIEAMDQRVPGYSGVSKTMSRNRSRRGRKSSVPIFAERGKTPKNHADSGTPARRVDVSSATEAWPVQATSVTGRRKLGHRKSIMAFFRRDKSEGSLVKNHVAEHSSLAANGASQSG